MPLFEYHCEPCEATFELLVRTANETVACPICGSNKTPEKLMSAAAGRVSSASSLPISAGCPPSDAPPCNPHCCRLPQ